MKSPVPSKYIYRRVNNPYTLFWYKETQKWDGKKPSRVSRKGRNIGN